MPKAPKSFMNQNATKPEAIPGGGMNLTTNRNGTHSRSSVRKGSRGSRVVGSKKGTSVIAEVSLYLADYIVLPQVSILVCATWIVAAYLVDRWDRFPHLAITSPEKRCAKTRLLQLIALIASRAYNLANISPSAIYRLVKAEQPTLLLDEAQSMSRRGSEASEVIRELFNSSIDRNATVIRCGGNRMDEIIEFPIYSPKVIALIGELDGVLADRCLPIRLERKTADQIVLPYRSRIVEPRGQLLKETIEAWADANGDRVAGVYDKLEPYSIDNDRLAELLLPLQAVLAVADETCLPDLWKYAEELERTETDRVSVGVQLLMACREIFGSKEFLPTQDLLKSLVDRTEEPWHRWSHGGAMSVEALAKVLKPFGIKPDRRQRKINGSVKTTRGYFAGDFQDAWARYTPS